MSDDLRIASGLLQQGSWRQARTIVLEVLADVPDSHQALCLLAASYNAAGDFGAMLTAADRAVATAPRDEWGYRLQAVALRHLGRLDRAAESARRAVALAPNGWVTHSTLAETLLAQNPRRHLAEAYRAATRGVELAPQQAPARVTMGLARAAAGDHRGARAEYRLALQGDPTLSAPRHNLALQQAARGSVVGAARGLRAARDAGTPLHAYQHGLGILALAAVAVAALAGAVLSLAATLVAATHPAAPVRLAVGLLAAAGYLAGCVALAVRLRRIEPGLPRLARYGRNGAALAVLAVVLPAQALLLVLAAVLPDFTGSDAFVLILAPALVLLLAAEQAVITAARRAAARSRLRRARRP
jgi:Flp pilus assembly protein TadD